MKRAAFDEASTAQLIAISQDLLASPPAIHPGQQLGDRYTVGERIGGGGMADVFRGHDPYLHRDIAIKVIKHGMASAEMCGRMLQEGRATAAIDHPHLLRVLDFGRVGATVYLVTDLLRGCSLAQHLRALPDNRLDWREAIELLLPALDALAKIHDHGLIHRDLKPDNLFVHHRDGREALIVLDLGIAKVSPALRGVGNLQTTESGRVMGTPAYMSPEQASGKPLVDHQRHGSASHEIDDAIDGRPITPTEHAELTGHLDAARASRRLALATGLSSAALSILGVALLAHDPERADARRTRERVTLAPWWLHSGAGLTLRLPLR